MKFKIGILLALLLSAVIALPSCFNSGNDEYQQKLKAIQAYQEQMDAYNKQQQEYNEAVIKAYAQYTEQYQQYQNAQLQQAAQQAAKAMQTPAP
jgi:hypothetical protein